MEPTKTSPQEYNGAEKLAERLVEYCNYEIAKKPVTPDYTLNVIRNACFDAFKSVIKCELMQMLSEVGDELAEMEEEYYRSGKPLEA